jgi:Kdo2-lipid IVA lauroyltransferase/acyltransferase
MSHRIEYFLFQFLKRLVLLLPLKSVQRLGAFLGTAAYLLVWKRREVALENLQRAFPGRPPAELKHIAHHAFQNYGISILEFLWFPNFTAKHLQTIVDSSSMDVFHNCLKRGKGIVAVSAHFGNWEIIAPALGLLTRTPASIVVQTQSNEYVDKIINSHRTMFGNRVVPMGIAVREIIRALKNSEIIALAADQSGPQEGPYVDFFGRMTATHQGPAVFALRMGSPMVLVLAIRNPDGTYRVVIEEIPTDDLQGESESTMIELTQRHARALEKYIRQYPDQWLWMHRRWKHSYDSTGDTMKDGAHTDV